MKKILSLVLCLVLLVSLAGNFTIKAAAIEANIDATASNAQYYPSGCLKSLDISVQATSYYGQAYGKIAVHSGASAYDYEKRYTNDGSSWPSLTGDPTFIALGSGEEFMWTDMNRHTMTVTFADNVIVSGTNAEYEVYLWTRSTRYGVYPDKHVGTISMGEDLKFNDEVLDPTPEVHTHSWTVTTTGNGTKEAVTFITCDCGEMLNVTLTAEDVILPGDVFNAKITVSGGKDERSLRAMTLTVSEEPGYKYSATGSDYATVDPAAFAAKAGFYQASILIMDGQNTVENLFVRYNVADPAITAPTGDNRPIEMMLLGMMTFAALAAVAFVVYKKREV